MALNVSGYFTRESMAIEVDGSLGGRWVVEVLMRVKNLAEAIELCNTSNYGNGDSIFTSSGKSAREFQYNVASGNVGIVAPMAFFPFSGMKAFLLDTQASYADALAQAVALEEKTLRFYADAAEQSKSLMADVSRAFVMVAKKRASRKQQLESMLDR